MVSQIFQSSRSTPYDVIKKNWRHEGECDVTKQNQVSIGAKHDSRKFTRRSLQGEDKTVTFFITLLRRDNVLGTLSVLIRALQPGNLQSDQFPPKSIITVSLLHGVSTFHESNLTFFKFKKFLIFNYQT